jgi:predicted RNA-binding protein with RPS1 domain
MQLFQLTFVCAIIISAANAFSSTRLSPLKPNLLRVRVYSTGAEANVEEKAIETVGDGIKPCYWKSPEGMCRTSVGEFRPVKGGWEHRLQLKDLKVGQKLIGEKISKTDLLQAKTGPKIFYDCGVGRIDAKGNWQMVSGMLRVAKSYNKPSVVRKKVARLSGKPVEIYVHKISIDTGRLEVKLSLDDSNKELEKESPKIPASSLKEGQELIWKIVQLRPYGAIIDVGANRKGLLHIQRVADLFEKYIDKEKGLEEAGLERGASIRVAVSSNEKKRLFLDFTTETKDLAAEEAEYKKKEAEEAAAAEAAAAFGLDIIEEQEEDEDTTNQIPEDEAAAWAAYADDFADDYANDSDEDADIEDSLGIGSY